MKLKKWAVRFLAAMFAVSQCLTVFAGAWEQRDNGNWFYHQDDGSYRSGGWFQDPADGRWYYLDNAGVMQSGWLFTDGKWYFLNTVHDGTFGAMFANGWQWIDGYCYLFDASGAMYAGTTTPDGYTVDSDGHWTENGIPVYTPGKGIITKSTPRTQTSVSRHSYGGGGSSSGSGGSGGGGGGSSVSTYYGYTVVYADTEGKVLESVKGEAKKNSYVTVPRKEFDGYRYSHGQDGAQKLTSDGMTFTVYYEKLGEPPTEEDPGTNNGQDAETYSYTVLYVDSETGSTIREEQGSAEKGSVITVEDREIEGYRADAGNVYTFTLSEDRMEVRLYYTRVKEIWNYEIRYEGNDGKRLATIRSIAEEGDTVTVPEREFEGYTPDEGQERSFVLERDNTVFTVLYTKDEGYPDATESEPEKELLHYEIRYIDRGDESVKMTETGTGNEGDEIVPDQRFDGYEYEEDYTFTLENDGDVFEVYLVKTEEEPDIVEVSYTVECRDEQKRLLETHTGTVSAGSEPVAIHPDYAIDGYERIGNNEFFVTRDGENTFVLWYREVGEFIFTVECMDIDSGEKIKDVLLRGNAGKVLDISGICPDGYRSVGEPPEHVTVSSNANNNRITLYFKKITDEPEPQKMASYTIQFRAYGDRDTYVQNDITGTWPVGERMPVYFIRRQTDHQGRIWQAIDDSPRIFTVTDRAMNVFLIEFVHAGDIELPDNRRTYSIRYIAEDTGSVLGITTGTGMVGDVIAYRNSFADYGFLDGDESYVIQEDGDNIVDVYLQRVSFPGHDKNEHTGRYEGFEWIALFVDSEGEQLLPNVTGFTVSGDELYIDYPNVIDGDEVTYRAEKPSPYQEITDQTVYKQIIIRYETGDLSENKLKYWKDAAQQKKDEFYGTEPYGYYVAFREKNSWNDIGLKLGVGNAGSKVALEAETLEGWVIPQEALGSFDLDENGKKTVVQYESVNQESSYRFNERGYTIRFRDTDGNDLFAPYSGKLAFREGNSRIDFPVYYPDTFYDAAGNRWEADIKSPQSFVMSAMDTNEKTIGYHLLFENNGDQFIVTDNADVNRVLNEFAVQTDDTDMHEFYVIGKDYNPGTAEVSETMYINNLAGYGNEEVDRFELDGVTYIVVRIGYYRKWDQDACSHKWELAEELRGSCLTAAHVTVRCSKCGKEVEAIYPANGHIDENCDSLCDVCGLRIKQSLGDEITVAWDSGTLGFGTINYNFVCVDTDYNGTGKMLYVCEDDLIPEVYGTYAVPGVDPVTADWGSSALRIFLDDEFANGLSVRTALQTIDGCAVTMLTKEEYDRYKDAAVNNYPFPSGLYLTKSSDADTVTLSDGSRVSAEEASAYPARPVLLMDRSDETASEPVGVWKVGDMQVREIGDTPYLFRCVSTNYLDKTNTDKEMALFLCDTVIPADAGLGFDMPDGTQSTRFFGETNNYKYSTVNQWLEDNKKRTDSLTRVNIGIVNEYTGSTGEGKFQSLDINSLKRYTRSNAQVMYSNMFIPSVEEAVAMKDYLWKFNGSDTNNPETVANSYCLAYWLRTPVHGEDDMVYTVNLLTGCIEPKPVKATTDNEVSTTGIRPMYITEQVY